MSEEKTINENQPESGSVIPEKSKIPNVTIINVVLLVGLLILYVLYFLPGKTSDGQNQELASEISEITERMAEGSFNIAFVNSDSLMANYKLAVRLRSELEAEQRRFESDFQRRQKNFQEDVESFQRQVQRGFVSAERAQEREQDLMLRQQELIQLNETYTNRLMTREMEMNRQLYGNITELLERINKEMDFDYILGFSPGGGILFANQRHDITAEVLKRLNAEYDAAQNN